MKDIKPINLFCQEVFPQLYDETLTSYELLCKIIDYVNIILSDNKKLIDEVTNIKKYVDTYFANLDVNTEISRLITELANNPESQLYKFIASELNSFNVKDFGAVGDGITDDTSAIYRAISKAKGRTIYFPEGIYVCSDRTQNDDIAVDLRGCGNVEIKRVARPEKPNGNYLMAFRNTPFAHFENITFNCERDKFLVEKKPTFDINGNAINTDETYLEWVDTACIYFYKGGKNITFKNCTFKNCSREGVMVTEGAYENIVIKYCKFINTSANFWATTKVTQIKNVYFENNYVEECRTMPVEFDNKLPVVAENIKVRNNKFFNICKCAVHLTACKNVEVCENEYINKGVLFENGRYSTDSVTSIFVWCDATKESENAFMGENISIHKNKINGDVGIQFQGLFTDIPDNGYHYKNTSIYQNHSTGKRLIVARFVENMCIFNNYVYTTGVVLEMTQCNNVELTSNVGTALSLFSENTISRDGNTIDGTCKNITVINNRFELTGAVFNLLNSSFGPDSVLNMKILNNECNGWELIPDLFYHRRYPIKHCSNNFNTGNEVISKVTSSNDKIALTLNAYIDEMFVDLSAMPQVDGVVTLRTIKTYRRVGRHLYIKYDKNLGVVTENSAVSEDRILNVKNIEKGTGMIIAVATPNGWYIL